MKACNIRELLGSKLRNIIMHKLFKKRQETMQLNKLVKKQLKLPKFKK